MAVKKDEIHTLSPWQKAARAGSFTILLVILVGLFFGRAIERTSPALMLSLPLIGIVALLLVFASLYWLFRNQKIQTPHLGRGILFALLAAAISIYGASSLVVAPIERIHFVKYGLLAFCVFFWSKEQKCLTSGLKSFAITATIGALEESSQLYIPDRVFDPRDLLLNSVGAVIGALLACAISSSFSQSTSVKQP